MSESILRNTLSSTLTTPQKRVVITPFYNQIVASSTKLDRSRSPSNAKDLDEVFILVNNVITDYQKRENVINDAKIVLTEEDPDYFKDDNINIVFSLISRKPSSLVSEHNSQINKVVNLVPMLREEIDDTENPGYKRAIFGYFHDNEVKFTIYARTNKVANKVALWFEKIMQEYKWYFTIQGVSRFMFLERKTDLVSEVKGQKLYGRPIHYLIKTETLTTISQKTLEQIEIGISENLSLDS